jgi:hypothetical protein
MVCYAIANAPYVYFQKSNSSPIVDYYVSFPSFNNDFKPIVLLKFDATFTLNIVFNKTDL